MKNFQLKLYQRGKEDAPNTTYFILSEQFGVKKKQIKDKLKFYFKELQVMKINMFRNGRKTLIRVRFKPTQHYPWDA